ncbi:MAG: hypothetical protein GY870_02845 [archaeon]|nr:hypothetical protein [archaeon]
MSNEMTLRQRILNTFSHKKIDQLVFSPRLYYWYQKNGLFQMRLGLKRKTDKDCASNIPKKFLGKSQQRIFDDLGASSRYITETSFIPLCFDWKRKVKIQTTRNSNGTSTTYYKTPIGTLQEIRSTIGGGLFLGRRIEFPVKTLEDIKIMKYIIEKSNFIFLDPFYFLAKKLIGEKGVVSTFTPLRSPYQRCILDLMGFKRTIVFLKRYPREMEEFLNFISITDDYMFDRLAKSPLEILNFGENIDARLTPPKYFEKYNMPYYKKYVKKMHQAGKYCHIHMDGDLKDLLPYLNDLPFDGLEALTPIPQGDVTLEELKDAIGNKVFLDGIPSNIFLPQYSFEYVRDYTQKVMEIFSPNLILGVSDELSPNGDIRKIEMIAKMVKNFEIK